MTEEIGIKIRTDLDASGLKQLRTALASSRDEMKNVSRGLDKTSNDFKINQAAVKELTRVVKLSDKELNSYANSLNRVDNASKNVGNKNFTNLQNSFSGISSALNSVGLTIGLTALVSRLVTFEMEAVKSAATFEELRAGFVGSAEDIEKFRAATSYTVSQANLIKLSNQATDLGISLADQVNLFALAQDSSDKYGTSIEEGFMKIMNATDGSAKGLRAVGISVGEYNEELERLAKSQNVNLDNMDAEEQLTLRLKAIYNLTGIELENFGNKVMSTSDKIDALNASADDMKVQFGEGLLHGLQTVGGVLLQWTNNLIPGLAAEFYSLKNSIAGAFNDLPRILGAYAGGGILGMIEAIMNPPEKVNPEDMAEHGILKKPKIPPPPKPKPKINTGNNQTKQETNLVTELIKSQRTELDLLKIKNELTLNSLFAIEKQLEAGKSLVKNKEDELQLLTAIQNVNKEIQEEVSLEKMQPVTLGMQLSPIDTIGKPKEFTPEEISQYREEQLEFKLNRAQEVSDLSANVFNNLSQTLSLLGIETDSWAAKVIGVFQATSSALQFGKGFLGLLSFIPGLSIFSGFRADGGAVSAGSAYITGERGAELFMPSQNGYIFNNNDSKNILSALSGMRHDSNIYISGNIDSRFIEFAIAKRNQNKNYYKVA